MRSARVQGESLLDPGVTGKILERVRSGTAGDSDGPPIPGGESLTDQEQKILVSDRPRQDEPGDRDSMYLSEKTVRNYVSNILGKLQLHNRAAAAAWAVRHGLDGRGKGGR